MLILSQTVRKNMQNGLNPKYSNSLLLFMQNILKKYQAVVCVCRLIYNGRFVTCYACVFLLQVMYITGCC